MYSLITDEHKNPCVKHGKRDSVGRLYFFYNKWLMHTVWALEKPYILFRSWRPTWIYILKVIHSKWWPLWILLFKKAQINAKSQETKRFPCLMLLFFEQLKILMTVNYWLIWERHCCQNWPAVWKLTSAIVELEVRGTGAFTLCGRTKTLFIWRTGTWFSSTQRIPQRNSCGKIKQIYR